MRDHGRAQQRERVDALGSSKPFSTLLPPPDETLRSLMREYLVGRDLDWELAERNGWYPSSQAGDDQPRVVIPATASDSSNVYWQARYLGECDDRLRFQSPHGVTRGDAIVFVWPRRIHEGRPVIGVEGSADALAAAGEGYTGLAFMGLTPNDEVFDFLPKVVANRELRLAIDADQPEASIDLMVRILAKGVRCTLRSPYPYKDLAQAPRDVRRLLLA